MVQRIKDKLNLTEPKFWLFILIVFCAENLSITYCPVSHRKIRENTTKHNKHF